MGNLKTYLNKCLSIDRLGEKWCNQAVQSIIEAGRTISYIETYDPSQSDSLHLAIKNNDKKTFMHEFEQMVKFALAKLKLKRVKVAFDTTEDLTWCKNTLSIRPSVYDHALFSWQYLNVSIIEPIFVPLMSIPYTPFDDLDNLVINLIGYIRLIDITVELALFDRGFYHARLIDYMNNKKGGKAFPYLILIPERQAQKEYIQRTRNAGKRFDSFKHTFRYSKEKSTWNPETTIMVRIVDDETAWCYATNCKPSLLLCMQYPKRWNIETGFRVHDEARIKSKSKNSLIRFFYHLIGMLLLILWKLENTCRAIIFKRYLKEIQIIYSNLSVGERPPT